MKATLTVTAAIFLLLALETGSAIAQDYSAIRKANQDSVIFITSHRDSRDGAAARAESTGTGFIITEYGHVISANHVILDESPNTIVKVWGWIGSRNSVSKYPMEVVKRDPELDLVLLQLQIPSSLSTRPVKVGRSSNVALDSALYALGFPGTSDLSPATGILSNRSGPKGRWQTTLGINRGNSGGPVFDPKTNSVVAIAWAGNDAAQQITYVIPESYASNLMQLAGSTVIEEKIKAQLLQDPDVMRSSVVVRADQGTVMLRGFADSDAAKVKAENIASKVTGVKKISNDIKVVKEKFPSDELITSMIRARLLTNVDSYTHDKLAVETLNGTVMLSGFAKSSSVSNTAVATAKNVMGVKDVQNYILVYNVK